MKSSSKLCELCNNGASLYCEADSAFLCTTCDAEVHRANFLVARHIRHAICPKSQSYEFDLNLNPQSSSSHDHDQQQQQEFSSAISSSTTESNVKNKRKTNGIASSSPNRSPSLNSNKKAAEGIFVNWCRDLGLNGNVAAILLSSAREALGLCLTASTRSLPFRVCLTASFWYGLRDCSSGTGQRSMLTWKNLKRLEHLSRVPSKLILTVEMKLSDAVKVSRRETSPFDLEEGWAESS